MGIGFIGAVAKGVADYATARSKERTTALGGGLCVAALYFRVTNPKAMDATMFYIVFALGAVVALLKTEFMRAMAVAIVDAMKRRSLRRESEGRKLSGHKSSKRK